VKEGYETGCIAIIKDISSVKDEGEFVNRDRKASLKTSYE